MPGIALLLGLAIPSLNSRDDPKALIPPQAEVSLLLFLFVEALTTMQNTFPVFYIRQCFKWVKVVLVAFSWLNSHSLLNSSSQGRAVSLTTTRAHPTTTLNCNAVTYLAISHTNLAQFIISHLAGSTNLFLRKHNLI